MMTRRLVPIAVVAALALATRGELAAQDQKAVAADGRFLQRYTNQWSMSATLDDGRVIDAGLWRDRLELVTVDGRQVGRRTQIEDLKITAELNPQAAAAGIKRVQVTTTNDFDPDTMAPLARDVVDSIGRHTHLSFTPHGAAITRTGLASKPDYKGEADIAPPVFDYLGGLYGLLLVALPLQPGFDTDIPVLRLPPGAEERAARDTVHVKVTGRAPVRLPSGRAVDTWVVEAEGLEFYLAKEAPYVFRLVDRSRPGQVWSFDIVDVDAKEQADSTRFPCRTVHTFDFWAGDFDATPWNQPNSPSRGQLHNTREYDGCVIVERWVAAGGAGAGMSMSFYDVNRHAWRMIWNDDANSSNDLEGTYRDGAMRFEGWVLDANGNKLLASNVLQDVTPDVIRHIYSTSADNGKTWVVKSDGRFTRRKQ